MKLNTIRAASVVLALAAAGIPCRADDAAVKRDITQQLSQNFEALKKKDIKAYMDMYALDYSGKTADGKKVTRKQTETTAQQVVGLYKKFTDQTIEIDKLKVRGNIVEVQVHITQSAIMEDKEGFMGTKGREHKVVYESLSQDTWIKTAQGWKLKSEQDLRAARVLVDGKPFKSG